MKKELFKQLVAEFEKLGINPNKWIGTRTNVKRMGKNNMAETSINRFAVETEFEDRGAERILKLFDEEARYLGTLNDVQAKQLLDNLKIANKIIHPAPLPEAGIYALREGKELTSEEFLKKKAADAAKLDSAILKASMKVSGVDRTLAARLNLDMSKVSDWEKLQVWKDKHGVPDWAKESESGIGSLFKTREQNELADLGTQIDAIEKEGKSLVEDAQRLVDLAWRMSPEGQRAEEAARKALLKRMHEGKGFAGGVMGHRNDGYFRAIVRPFLLKQHENGIIKLADNTLESLKNSDDLKGGGDFMSADPVRVFRQHYGDDAFDLIPDQEVFGMGDTGYGPGRDRINEVMEKVIGKPILEVGPDNPGGYLTKGEYQAKLDEREQVLGYIKNKEGRFSDMSEKEIAEEIASVNAEHDTILTAFKIDHPTANFQKKDFRTVKEWEEAEVNAQRLEMEQEALKIKKQLDPEVEAEIGQGETHIEGRPYEVIAPKKDPLGIRLIKNFDQELTDEGLAKEGYNLQEIGIIKRARQVMKEENQNPTDAMRWVRGEMADEAGVDIDEFMTDFQWDDTFDPSDKFAQGGGVGSLFKPTDRARYSTGTEIGKEVAKYAGKTIGEIIEILKKNKKIRDLIKKTNEKLHETGIAKMWQEKTSLDKKNKIVADKVLAPFIETVDKMTPWKISDKSSRNATLAWFREELSNPHMRKVYHPEWEKGTTVYRGMKSPKNMEYSRKHDSRMFTGGHHPGYTYKPEHVGSFASKDPSHAIRFAVEGEGFPRVTKTHLDPIAFQEAAERNVLENPYGVTSDVILDAEQKAALKTDLLATGIAAAKKYWPFSKGGSVSRQTLFEDGILSMFRRV